MAENLQPFTITPEQRLSLIGILLSLFLAALDQTIVATALPRIVVDLSGTSLYAWVATSYLLASTVVLPIFGRLAEILARKWVLLVAVLIFLIGSGLSGISTSMGALIAFRAVQGVGSGGIFAVAVTVLGLLFPPRQRGRVQGLFGAVFGIANVLGPWLGGLLTDHLSWRAIFYVNMPFGLIALYFLAVHMPRLQPEGRHRFDYLGAAAIAVMTVPLLLAFSWGGTNYAWDSGRIISLLCLSALGIAAFVWAELRNPEPLFYLPLFSDRTFRWSMVGSFFFGAAFLGAILFLPFYLVQVQGISATDSGLSLTPMTLGIVVGSFVSGQLATRLGRYKGLLVAGLAWLVAALAVAHLLIALHTPLWQVWAIMVAVGLGMGPGMPIYTLSVQNAVPRSRMGVASSASQFFRQIGSSTGAALMGAVLVATMQADVGRYLPAGLHGSKSQFESAQASSASAIGPAVRKAFAQTEREIDKALAGSAGAYGAVQRSGAIPSAYKRDIPRGGIPAAVAAGFAQAEREVRGAFAGDRAAAAALSANPEIPAAVKAAAIHPPARPAARAAALQAIEASMRAAEPGAAQAALRAAQHAVGTRLQALARTVTRDLVQGIDYAITEAVRRVYLYAALLAALALLFGLLLPDAQLRHQHREETSLAPAEAD